MDRWGGCVLLETKGIKDEKTKMGETSITLYGHGSLIPSFSATNPLRSAGTTINTSVAPYSTQLRHGVTSTRGGETRNLRSFTFPLSLQCLCHSYPRPPTTLLTTFKPARGKDNARSPCSRTLHLPSAPPQRIPPRTPRRISTRNPRVLPLSPPNPPQSSRTPLWPMARYHPKTF